MIYVIAVLQVALIALILYLIRLLWRVRRELLNYLDLFRRIVNVTSQVSTAMTDERRRSSETLSATKQAIDQMSTIAHLLKSQDTNIGELMRLATLDME